MKVLRIIIAISLLYVLPYAVLSVCGRYQPYSVGVAGVKEYAWAPFGFYDPDHAWAGSSYAVLHPAEKTGGWHLFTRLAFGPLWELDCELIHNGSPPEDSNSSRKDSGQ